MADAVLQLFADLMGKDLADAPLFGDPLLWVLNFSPAMDPLQMYDDVLLALGLSTPDPNYIYGDPLLQAVGADLTDYPWVDDPLLWALINGKVNIQGFYFTSQGNDLIFVNTDPNRTDVDANLSGDDLVMTANDADNFSKPEDNVLYDG